MDMNIYPYRYNHTLPVPASNSFTPANRRYVFIDQAVIINAADVHNNYQRIRQSAVYPNNDEVLILEGFDRVTERYNGGGVSKHLVIKNLKMSKYSGSGEEGELCVICQDEFKRKEMLAVLECKHRYHPECIKEWLIRMNVCPVCKSQGLKV
ncbi:putative transcription factor C2H2 family [Helianthus annuus]|nr:putative transcription factor C2H2 family [Helianthus annuus]